MVSREVLNTVKVSPSTLKAFSTNYIFLVVVVPIICMWFEFELNAMHGHIQKPSFMVPKPLSLFLHSYLWVIVKE